MYIDDSNKITELEYVNTDIPVETLSEKNVILDIRVCTAKNHEIDIEMQVRNTDDYIKRCVYYFTNMYSRQPIKGKKYNELNKWIVISILDFVLLEDSDDLHNAFRLKEIKKNYELTDTIEIHFVELPKIDSLIRVNKPEDIDSIGMLGIYYFMEKLIATLIIRPIWKVYCNAENLNTTLPLRLLLFLTNPAKFF